MTEERFTTLGAIFGPLAAGYEARQWAEVLPEDTRYFFDLVPAVSSFQIASPICFALGLSIAGWVIYDSFNKRKNKGFTPQ